MIAPLAIRLKVLLRVKLIFLNLWLWVTYLAEVRYPVKEACAFNRIDWTSIRSSSMGIKSERVFGERRLWTLQRCQTIQGVQEWHKGGLIMFHWGEDDSTYFKCLPLQLRMRLTCVWIPMIIDLIILWCVPHSTSDAPYIPLGHFSIRVLCMNAIYHRGLKYDNQRSREYPPPSEFDHPFLMQSVNNWTCIPEFSVNGQ